MRFILASASPRRADLLRAAGYAFEVRPTDIDESVEPDEAPETYVRRLAVAKARRAQCRDSGDVALGADTSVVVDHHILGKPEDATDAVRMLELLSGRTHDVLTGIALRQGNHVVADVACTRVRFLPLAPQDISWYVATGEPMGKAGGYAIQGYASRFIDQIHGSYSNVVGLPVHLVALLWARLKLTVESSPQRGIS